MRLTRSSSSGLEHRGETADDVIKAQDRHLKEAEKAGDAAHQQARNEMKGASRRRPRASRGSPRPAS
ncbi:hypothetical protein BKD30_09835 [Tersicoccus phoenicis]|uniref:Uncharacterized protein n=1 Tax=Tersicoccus phoenicis TaxID=554083 RepID=A0A1R1L9G0_9MICC|nr:hypothetical protein BKD30_09835 [Tersicoccus phoenicis]